MDKFILENALESDIHEYGKIKRIILLFSINKWVISVILR